MAKDNNQVTRLKEFFSKKDTIKKEIPWASTLGYGVVLTKKGFLQKTYTFRGPDLQAASHAQMNVISAYVNKDIMMLGTGWSVFWTVHHYETAEYPGSKFYDVAAYLVDKEREITYKSYGKHFKTSFYMTFVYEPPVEITKKAFSLIIKRGERSQSVDGETEKFLSRLAEVTSILRGKFIMEELTDDETVQFLHISVTQKRHYMKSPSVGFFLENILNDVKIENTMPLRINDRYSPIISINDFPTETYPAMLDELNKARYEYVWSTRFGCMDKKDALADIKSKQNQFYSQRDSWSKVIGEAFTKEKSDKVDHGAIALEGEVNEAQIQVTKDFIGFGKYTSSVMVWDDDLEEAEKKANNVIAIINNSGFSAIKDEFNAFDNYKSMMPGELKANVRKDPISTANLSHVVPISSIWAGLETNDHLGSITGTFTPHVVCSTLYGTPFFLNLTYKDLGHAMILGPTGSGKSTLLQLLEIQWKKYQPSRVIILDVDRSARQLTKAMNGTYFEPGGKNRITLQPLEDLEDEADLAWCAEFIELLLNLQNIEVTPGMSTEISKVLSLMKDSPKEQRTLTTFNLLCNYHDPITKERTINDGIYTYTREGKHGQLFDGTKTDIDITDWTMFEMRPVMEKGDDAIQPVLKIILKYIHKVKDASKPTLLVFDEVWRFLKHPKFADSIMDMLLTFRKFSVYCVFATQEVSAALNSPIATTLISQIKTKIYLADESATNPKIADNYDSFGLTNEEIEILAAAKPQQDYYYKSPLGVRLFQLELGPVALGLFGDQDHDFLDGLDDYDTDNAFKILDSKGVDYAPFIQENA